MHVDYERLVLRLKQEVAAKGSHGRRDLLSLIATLEAECSTPETEGELDDLRVMELALARLRASSHSGASNGSGKPAAAHALA